MGYFDKDGQPIDARTLGRLLSDDSYRGVALTEVGETSVSTVWLGINHRFDEKGPPLIFETMVFGFPFSGPTPPVFDERWHSLECHRYATLEEALAGHARVVESVRALLS